jgi:hypothetical protein
MPLGQPPQTFMYPETPVERARPWRWRRGAFECTQIFRRTGAGVSRDARRAGAPMEMEALSFRMHANLSQNRRGCVPRRPSSGRAHGDGSAELSNARKSFAEPARVCLETPVERARDTKYLATLSARADTLAPPQQPLSGAAHATCPVTAEMSLVFAFESSAFRSPSTAAAAPERGCTRHMPSCDRGKAGAGGGGWARQRGSACREEQQPQCGHASSSLSAPRSLSQRGQPREHAGSVMRRRLALQKRITATRSLRTQGAGPPAQTRTAP